MSFPGFNVDIKIWPGNNVPLKYSNLKVRVSARHSFEIFTWPEYT